MPFVTKEFMKLMYFIMKYNVFNKYIINVTTTEINTCKKNIWIWSKGGNLFPYVSYKQGRALYYLLKVNKHWLNKNN
jgi:hypothetical protein